MRAMSLVYTTLLSMVPLLAISFSVLKGFGVHNEAAPMLFSMLEPLGVRGVDIAIKILEFVEKMKVGVLGSVGLALLIYTVISVMQKIERALNHIWRVKKPRGLAERFSDYISVLLIGPLFIVISMGISASAMNASLVKSLSTIPAIGLLIQLSVLVVPFLLSVFAFAFIYIYIPNTKVQIRPAIIGAVVASLLWKGAGWVFATFVVTSTKYAAVYSAFATLIFFMIWLYLTWLILMIGSTVSFYYQHAQYLSRQHDDNKLSSRVKEKLGLFVMQLISLNFYNERPAWTLEQLAGEAKVPGEAMNDVVSCLEDNGLLVKSSGENPTFIPGKPLDITPVSDILSAIRSADEKGYIEPEDISGRWEVNKLSDNIDNAIFNVLKGKMIKDLITEDNRTDNLVEAVPFEALGNSTPRR